jgi:threonine/homoserine/homoserine lactone efflux protein
MEVLNDPSQVIAFVTFSAIFAGTPGPSNTLLTAVGARAGVRTGLASLLGQVTGDGCDAVRSHPRTGQSTPGSSPGPPGTEMGRGSDGVLDGLADATAGHAQGAVNAPAGFLGMAAFQWVNPKGWLIGVAAVATFLDQRADGALHQAVLFAILFTLAAFPSCFPWLAFGAALQRFLRTPRAQRILNLAMAALLAASTIFVWARI